MARACHRDTCPVGITTQRRDLRDKYAGTPEMIAAYPRPPFITDVPKDFYSLNTYSFWKVGPDALAKFDAPNGNHGGEHGAPLKPRGALVRFASKVRPGRRHPAGQGLQVAVPGRRRGRLPDPNPRRVAARLGWEGRARPAAGRRIRGRDVLPAAGRDRGGEHRGSEE